MNTSSNPPWIRVPSPPYCDDEEYVAVDVHLLRVSDNVERVSRDTAPLASDVTICTFLWEEGNYACDCNRYLLFQRAGGDSEEDIRCSQGQYTVWITNPADGRVLYDER
jgi:hypothetical protein